MPRLSERPPPKGSLTTPPKSSAWDRISRKRPYSALCLQSDKSVWHQAKTFDLYWKPQHGAENLKPYEESPRFQFSYLRHATGKLQNWASFERTQGNDVIPRNLNRTD